MSTGSIFQTTASQFYRQQWLSMSDLWQIKIYGITSWNYKHLLIII